MRQIFYLLFFLFPVTAWAHGAFYETACTLEGLSQGAVGIIIAISALAFGSVLAVYTRSLLFLVPTIGIALAAYYGPEVINLISGVSIQDCSLSESHAAIQGENVIRALELRDALCNAAYNRNTSAGEYCTSCNGSSSSPNCVAPSQNYTYSTSNLGNPISLVSSNGSYCLTGHGSHVSSYYDSCINYSGSSFSGCINVGGTAMVGYVCGGNSGICGSGNTLIANSLPPTVCGPNNEAETYYGGTIHDYPESTQIANGGPLTYQSGQFSGSPINVYYISGTGQTMHTQFVADGPCVTELLNGNPEGQYCP